MIMKHGRILFFPVAVFLATQVAWADIEEDGAYLDPPYTDLVHPIVDDVQARGQKDMKTKRSDTLEVIAKQSSVKSQGSRGTCSIFSTVAILEGTLDRSSDLSEEWLSFLMFRNTTTEGSNTGRNYSMLKKHGITTEKLLPYISARWDSASSSSLAEARCGKLEGFTQKTCLNSHFNAELLEAPEAALMAPSSALHDLTFLAARRDAAAFRDQLDGRWLESARIYSTTDAKKMLRNGTPLILNIDFYYGAWNHSRCGKFGIERNMDDWNKGIIGHPEEGSIDRAKSTTERAGHSVLLVGYDDTVVVKKKIPMADGTVKEFTYKGVYYFKNSWGRDSFGRDFAIDGSKYPGYGMIVQKYVNEFGEFYLPPVSL